LEGSRPRASPIFFGEQSVNTYQEIRATLARSKGVPAELPEIRGAAYHKLAELLIAEARPGRSQAGHPCSKEDGILSSSAAVENRANIGKDAADARRAGAQNRYRAR
jgi:hypothetical protein